MPKPIIEFKPGKTPTGTDCVDVILNGRQVAIITQSNHYGIAVLSAKLQFARTDTTGRVVEIEFKA